MQPPALAGGRCAVKAYDQVSLPAASAAGIAHTRVVGRLIRAAGDVGGVRHLVNRRQQGLRLAQVAQLELRRLQVIAKLLHGVGVDQCAGRLALGVNRRLQVTAIMLSHWLFVQCFYWFPNSSDYLFIPLQGAGRACRVYRYLSSLVSR